MNCDKTFIYSNLYIDNQLSEDDRELLQAHLTKCERCQNTFNDLCQLNKLLTEEEKEIPFDLTEVIMEKISFYRLNERYKENKRLKVILVVETIFVIILTYLSLPGLMSNMMKIYSFINNYVAGLGYLNDLMVPISLSYINILTLWSNDSLSSGIYLSLAVICIIFNVILINKIRRQFI